MAEELDLAAIPRARYQPWHTFIKARGPLAELDTALRNNGYVRAKRVRSSFKSGRVRFCFTWTKETPSGIDFRISHIEQIDLRTREQRIKVSVGG